MIEVRRYSSLGQVAALREAMDAVNLASARPDPFSTFGFYENFLANDEFFPAGAGLRLWFLVGFDAGRPIAYLVLKEVRHRVLGVQATKLDFFVTRDTDRPHLVCVRGEEKRCALAFYQYLLSRPDEWTHLEFCQQDASSPLYPPPELPELSKYWVRTWPSKENGTIPVRWASLHDYFRAFSQKFRSNVSRQMRTLLAAGDVQYLESSDPAVTPLLLDLYRTIEPRSWKHQADAAIGRHPKRVEYFLGLLRANGPMRLSVHLVLLDGIPIAGLINGAFEKGLYALHMVFDDRMDRLAPGSALLLMGMRQAIEGDYVFFNLLSGFSYYKLRWQAEITETKTAQLFRVGKPFFWKAMFGGFRRRLLRAPAGETAPLDFNPVRREVKESLGSVEQTGQAALKPRISDEDKATIDRLRGRLSGAKLQWLSTAQLAAVMPFETRR